MLGELVRFRPRRVSTVYVSSLWEIRDCGTDTPQTAPIAGSESSSFTYDETPHNSGPTALHSSSTHNMTDTTWSTDTYTELTDDQLTIPTHSVRPGTWFVKLFPIHHLDDPTPDRHIAWHFAFDSILQFEKHHQESKNNKNNIVESGHNSDPIPRQIYATTTDPVATSSPSSDNNRNRNKSRNSTPQKRRKAHITNTQTGHLRASTSPTSEGYLPDADTPVSTKKSRLKNTSSHIGSPETPSSATRQLRSGAVYVTSDADTAQANEPAVTAPAITSTSSSGGGSNRVSFEYTENPMLVGTGAVRKRAQTTSRASHSQSQTPYQLRAPRLSSDSNTQLKDRQLRPPDQQLPLTCLGYSHRAVYSIYDSSILQLLFALLAVIAILALLSLHYQANAVPLLLRHIQYIHALYDTASGMFILTLPWLALSVLITICVYTIPTLASSYSIQQLCIAVYTDGTEALFALTRLAIAYIYLNNNTNTIYDAYYTLLNTLLTSILPSYNSRLTQTTINRYETLNLLLIAVLLLESMMVIIMSLFSVNGYEHRLSPLLLALLALLLTVPMYMTGQPIQHTYSHVYALNNNSNNSNNNDSNGMYDATTTLTTTDSEIDAHTQHAHVDISDNIHLNFTLYTHTDTPPSFTHHNSSSHYTVKLLPMISAIDLLVVTSVLFQILSYHIIYKNTKLNYIQWQAYTKVHILYWFMAGFLGFSTLSWYVTSVYSMCVYGVWSSVGGTVDLWRKEWVAVVVAVVVVTGLLVLTKIRHVSESIQTYYILDRYKPFLRAE